MPYVTQETSAESIIPLMYYEDDRFFVHGLELEAGVKLYETEDWRFSALSKMRFLDIPQEYKNQFKGAIGDFGLQTRYKIQDNQYLDLEFMQDVDSYRHANLKYSALWNEGSWQVKPYFNLRYKSADFNRHYYALDQEAIGAGVDAAIGISAKFHVISNFYLIGLAQSRWLDANARSTSAINENTQSEVSIGVALLNDTDTPKNKDLHISPYLRLAHGWGTSSNLNAILSGDTEVDEFNNQLTSIFYGYPLTDELFGLPLDVFITPGFVWHWESEVQDFTQEYVLAIKAYYTVELPIRFRFGLAEGLSYIQDVTYIEKTELEEKGYQPNKLLNYLDLSLDVHLGDIFGKTMDDIWLGYSIHHRSAIFESAAQFGRIKGGSNYNTVYLQWHY